MALLGTLTGFGITEIFQLISQQMKTGALILSAPKNEVSIIFRDGIIIGIVSDKWEDDPRARILLDNNILPEKTYRTAMDNQEKKSIPWHEILISQGNIKESILEKASNMIIRETLLETFQWKEGSYRFDESEPNYRNMLSCYLPAEGIILDTLRVIDEWPIIKAKLPPVDYSPVKVMPLTEEIVRSQDLSPMDMQIFDLIDDTKTIEELVRESLETRFDALGSIVRLIEAGLIETFPRGSKQKLDRSIQRRAMSRRFKSVAVYLLLAGTVVILSLIGQPRPNLLLDRGSVIRDNIRSQRELASEYAKQGTTLSTLKRDIHALSSESSPE